MKLNEREISYITDSLSLMSSDLGLRCPITPGLVRKLKEEIRETDVLTQSLSFNYIMNISREGRGFDIIRNIEEFATKTKKQKTTMGSDRFFYKGNEKVACVSDASPMYEIEFYNGCESEFNLDLGYTSLF